PAGDADHTGLPIDARLRALEEKTLRDALAASGGNQAHAARLIGISRRALIHRMAKYGIRPARGAGRP
ncbi:MAG: helix-turn-helix domain-containing protein, partial [Myxococcota bacterium]|nr:helix-turn-helix domain-containing protein [Myxococcota bacterium]